MSVNSEFSLAAAGGGRVERWLAEQRRTEAVGELGRRRGIGAKHTMYVAFEGYHFT